VLQVDYFDCTVQGWTPILTLAVSTAVLGSSAQFGYNTGVFNSPQDVGTSLCVYCIVLLHHVMLHHVMLHHVMLTSLAGTAQCCNDVT